MSWAWPFWKEPPESPLPSSWRSTTRHFTASWTWRERAERSAAALDRSPGRGAGRQGRGPRGGPSVRAACVPGPCLPSRLRDSLRALWGMEIPNSESSRPAEDALQPSGRSVSVRSGRRAEEGPGVHTLCRVTTASAAPTALEALRPGSTRALGQRVCGGGGSQAASLPARSTEGDLTHYGHGLFRRAGTAALGQRPPRQPAQSARGGLLLQGGAGP